MLKLERIYSTVKKLTTIVSTTSSEFKIKFLGFEPDELYYVHLETNVPISVQGDYVIPFVSDEHINLKMTIKHPAGNPTLSKSYISGFVRVKENTSYTLKPDLTGTGIEPYSVYSGISTRDDFNVYSFEVK